MSRAGHAAVRTTVLSTASPVLCQVGEGKTSDKKMFADVAAHLQAQIDEGRRYIEHCSWMDAPTNAARKRVRLLRVQYIADGQVTGVLLLAHSAVVPKRSVAAVLTGHI